MRALIRVIRVLIIRVKPFPLSAFQAPKLFPMYRKMLLALCALFLLTIASEAQMRRVYGRPRYGRQRPAARQQLPRFQPTLNLSFGYGFPALDKDFMPEFYEAYAGNISQTGPFTGAIDYQFSRVMSIGVMVTHNRLTAPYYDYTGSPTVPAFDAKVENWSFMLNVVRYFPAGKAVSPYLRTAIGVNSWTQTYTAPDGSKAPVIPDRLPDLAYQAGLGVNLNLSKHAALTLEAGYGKYIVHGGLQFKL